MTVRSKLQRRQVKQPAANRSVRVIAAADFAVAGQFEDAFGGVLNQRKRGVSRSRPLKLDARIQVIDDGFRTSRAVVNTDGCPAETDQTTQHWIGGGRRFHY